MRQVMRNTDELIHVWVNGGQDTARANSRAMYSETLEDRPAHILRHWDTDIAARIVFKGADVSYRVAHYSHDTRKGAVEFKRAHPEYSETKIERKVRDSVCVLLWSESWSATTSRTLSDARAFTNSARWRFSVPYVRPLNEAHHVLNVEHMLKVARARIDTASRARLAHVVKSNLRQADERLREANVYAHLFGLQKATRDRLVSLKSLGAYHRDIAEQAVRLAVVEARENERAEAERVRYRVDDVDTAHDLALETNAQADAAHARMYAERAEQLEDWRSGSYVPGIRNHPSIYLRIVTPTVAAPLVETSWGAFVPVDRARALFLSWRSLHAHDVANGGNAYKRELIGQQIGAYTINAIDENEIAIGCHRLTFAECETFARAQGWVN